MNAMRQLHFFPHDVQAFSEGLRTMWEGGIRSIHAVGEPEWTAALAAAAAERGITLHRRDDLSGAAGAPGPKAVVFGETDGEKLGDRLVSCVGLDDVAVLAPITDWHFTRKPLFLVSIPKAGTHLLYELAHALGYDAGVECPAFPQGKTWYCVEYSNSHTVARDFFVDTVRHAPFGNRHHRFMRSPALFMYRHPLDILVSEAHYYHRDGKTAFAGWLSRYTFEERIERLCNDNWLMGSLRERIGGFLPWMDFPNVIPLSFEELIGAAGGGSAQDQCDLIWSIQLKLQAPGDAAAIAAAVFNPRSATFRAGQIGAYRDQLPAQTIETWSTRNADLLSQLGYCADGSIGLPADRAQRRRRPVRYSKVDDDRLPVTIEADFLGCNLVRYDNRIYAVPRAAGAIALDKAPGAKLAALPSAESIGEIKSLLLVGKSSLNDRAHALAELARFLRDEQEVVHRYWEARGEPVVIGAYNGFNLVGYDGVFFGLRQTLGEVDFSIDPREFVGRYPPDDVAVCASLTELRMEIDGLSTAQRVRKDSALVHERLLGLTGALETLVGKLDERVTAQADGLASIEDRIARLEASTAEIGPRMAQYTSMETLCAQLREAATVTAAQLEQRQSALELRCSELAQTCAAAVDRLEARQSELAQRCAERDARIEEIESSWPARLTRMVTRAIRGKS